MKDWRTLRLGGHHWSFLWISTLVTLLHAAPDPAAWHELSEAEYELVLRDLHPPRPASWDTGLARVLRHDAGVFQVLFRFLVQNLQDRI